MNVKQVNYVKSLRSQISLTIKNNFPGEDRQDLLNNWGYPTRISKINDIDLLKEIKQLASGQVIQAPTLGKLDSQGRYVISIMKRIKWDTIRVRQLLIKKVGKGTWLKLTTKEKRKIINIMKSYISKNAGGNTNQQTNTGIDSIPAEELKIVEDTGLTKLTEVTPESQESEPQEGTHANNSED
jgi:hypothetical protein